MKFLLLPLCLLIQIIFAPKVNLLLALILVFASLTTLSETLLLSVFAAALTSALLYQEHYPWVYIGVGLLASLLNPKQIPDKFILTLLYAIIFTALTEILNPNSSSYFDRLILSVPLATLAVIPLYFILLYFNKTRGTKNFYESSRR